MVKLNSKGYMLVEIILASVIAFGVAYFIINLTIKLKNKNDDMLVETQVKTDQAIITNKLMKLPDETIVYPGHGKSTMIGEEKPIYLELKPRGY